MNFKLYLIALPLMGMPPRPPLSVRGPKSPLPLPPLPRIPPGPPLLLLNPPPNQNK